MFSLPQPKEFEKTSEVLPFTKYGLSTAGEFRNEEIKIEQIELLKKAGLSEEEIALYQAHVADRLSERQKIEQNILQCKLDAIHSKINNFQSKAGSSKQTPEPEVPTKKSESIFDKPHKKLLNFYPEGHPMNELKEIEDSLFGHLKNDNIIPITKRRKILRRFERKKQRLLAQQHQPNISTINYDTVGRSGSLWDLKELPKLRPQSAESKQKRVIGPKNQTMYTIKDNKIVRLERGARLDEYQAVDIVMPINPAEEQLLEGTKMSIDDIRKIGRFKDYQPGVPSKVLYLKNIEPSVTLEQVSLLFNQFVLDNGSPVDVRLLTGRMRGQAFVTFQNENVCISALEEVNGTILSGRPIIAQFGRNNQIDEHR